MGEERTDRSVYKMEDRDREGRDKVQRSKG